MFCSLIPNLVNDLSFRIYKDNDIKSKLSSAPKKLPNNNNDFDRGNQNIDSLLQNDNRKEKLEQTVLH